MVLRYEEEPSLFPRPPACRMLLERKTASVNSIHAVACNYLKIKNHYHALPLLNILKSFEGDRFVFYAHDFRVGKHHCIVFSPLTMHRSKALASYHLRWHFTCYQKQAS